MRDMYDTESEPDILDDDQLQGLIQDRIDNDPAFWVGRGRKVAITVDVEDGYVTLNGSVRTAIDRRRADILARALGAEGVENKLQVTEPESRKRAS